MEAESYLVVKRGFFDCELYPLSEYLAAQLGVSLSACTSSSNHEEDNEVEKCDTKSACGTSKNKKKDNDRSIEKVDRFVDEDDDDIPPPGYDESTDDVDIDAHSSDDESKEPASETRKELGQMAYSINATFRKMTLHKGNGLITGVDVLMGAQRPKFFSTKMSMVNATKGHEDILMKRPNNRWRRGFEVEGNTYEWDVSCFTGHQKLYNTATGAIIAVFKRRNISYRKRGTLRIFQADQVSDHLRYTIFMTSHQVYLEESARRRRHSSGGGGGS